MNSHAYDFFLFAGQSNMAGRGIVTPEHPQPAPLCQEGAGWEFRAVSDPSRLYPICEPFGVNENREGGIYEPGMKTGSLVTAFTNAYYARTQVPIIGLSASKGGSSILEWQPGTDYLQDTCQRLACAEDFFRQKQLNIRHRFLLWCQGETDGDHEMCGEEYIARFEVLLNALMKQGIQHCFLIRIGNFNPTNVSDISPAKDYSTIQSAQKRLSLENSHVTLVSEKFDDMLSRGLMKDAFHYYQQAYNEVGTEAGEQTARLVSDMPTQE